MVDKVGLEVTASTSGADSSIRKTKKELLDLGMAAGMADRNVEELEKELGKDLPQAASNSSKEVTKLKKQIQALTASVRKSDKEIEGLSGAARKSVKDINSLATAALKAEKRIEELEKELGKDLPRAAKRGGVAVRKTTKEIKSLGRQSALTSGGIDGMTTSLRAASVALGVVAGFAAAQKFVTLADNFQSLEARIKDATRTTGDFQTVFEDLQTVSINLGTNFRENVGLFQSLSNASKSLGVSNKELIGVTKTLGELALLSGASAQDQANAFRQLSQGLGGGTFRAEEFNSVLEQTPAVIQAIADNIDRFAGDIGKFRAEIKKTGTPSIDVLRAIQKAADDTAERASLLPKTVSQAFEGFNTVLGKAASEFDKQIGLTDSLAEGITGLTASLKEFTDEGSNFVDLLNTIVNVAQVLGVVIGARLAGKAFGALQKILPVTTTRVNSFGTAVKTTTGGIRLATVATGALRGALALLGGPIGIIITLIGVAAVALSDYGETVKRTAAEQSFIDAAVRRSNARLKEQAKIIKETDFQKAIKQVQFFGEQQFLLEKRIKAAIEAGKDPAFIEALKLSQQEVIKLRLEAEKAAQSLAPPKEPLIRVGALTAEVKRIKELQDANVTLRDAQKTLSEQFLTDKQLEELAIQKQIDLVAGLAIEAGKTEAEITAIRTGIRDQFRAQQEQKEQEAAQTQIDNLRAGLLTQEDAIREAQTRREAIIKDSGALIGLSQAKIDALILATRKKTNDELTALDEASAMSRLETAQSVTGSLLSIIETFGGESTALGKALALTQIGINAAVAITKALAELGPIAGPFAAGAIAAVSAGAAAQVLAAKKGMAFGSGGNVIPFQKGGVVNTPTSFGFDRGQVGLMGEAGPEAILPLKRGPNGDLGVQTSAGGSAGTIVNVNNLSGATVDVTTERVGDREIINIAVSEARQAVANDFKRSLSTGYGDFAESVSNNFTVQRRA